MLDEICPVQFIEGINECGKCNTQNFLDIQGYQFVAIEYNPESTYCLTALEILIDHSPALGAREFDIALHSDYDGRPSDIILSRGKLATKVNSESVGTQFVRFVDWGKVDLNPVVVIRSSKYWITTRPDGRQLSLATAVDGDTTNMMAAESGKWRPDKLFSDWKCMLRFYGRILPVSN